MISEKVGNGLCLVDFYTDWCVPCKVLSETLSKIKEKYGDKLDLVKINAEEEPELSQECHVLSVPSMFIYKNGELKESLSGNVPQYKLEESLQKFI